MRICRLVTLSLYCRPLRTHKESLIYIAVCYEYINYDCGQYNQTRGRTYRPPYLQLAPSSPMRRTLPVIPTTTYLRILKKFYECFSLQDATNSTIPYVFFSRNVLSCSRFSHCHMCISFQTIHMRFQIKFNVKLLYRDFLESLESLIRLFWLSSQKNKFNFQCTF